jgi:hypothetical protein
MSALLAIALVETGCGLPDSYFLQPPTVVQPAAGLSSFSFLNPDHSNDLGVTFTGFELYYRFYNLTDTININAYDPTNPADPTTQLASAGFLPVRTFQDTPSSQSIPVIPIGPAVAGSSFLVQVNITGSPATGSQPTGPANYIVGTAGQVELRRNVVDPNHTYGYKNFLSNNYPSPSNTNTNYSSVDGDFSVVYNGATSNQYAYIALYALSYGLINLTTPTRSTPKYLGYESVSITRP